ncbi:MAG: hypothetical protein C0592_04345 [Marinilabiliales bacterium]|nr:MAG: hypothetical protein C0592_04345 [Marinilabiliales bacterium]
MDEVCKNCGYKSAASRYLTEDELSNQSRSCVELKFRKGDNIIRQGTLSSNVAFLKEGLVMLHMQGPLHEQITKITKAPSYLALPTTFGDKINHYSVTAIEESTICFIDINTFKSFISNNPNFTYQLFIELCMNELTSFRRCVNRTQKQVSGSLAENLLFFANNIYGSDEFTLPLSREELGNLVDASRESVSRILSDFQKDGIISTEKRMIKILNKEKLEMISRNG